MEWKVNQCRMTPKTQWLKMTDQQQSASIL